jgi:hypothetical protein
VQFVAVPAPDHRFAGWQGDVGSTAGGIAAAVMDRPRSVRATFEPLRSAIRTVPPGLAVRVDGVVVTTPASYVWTAESVHALEAPDLVDLDPADPLVLAFEGWSDLRPRAHDVVVRRDTFLTDFTAEYIQTIPAADVPAGGATVIRTPGAADVPRVVSLDVAATGGPVPEAGAILGGTIAGVRTTELVLVPSREVTQLDTFVEGGGTRGRTRLAVSNRGVQPATLGLFLRDGAGKGLVAVTSALTVAPGTNFLGELQTVMLLPDVFEGLLTIVADQPVQLSLQSVRENLRPSTMLDPVLLVPFTSADRNVPSTPRVQVLLWTADTEHRVVLFNSGYVPVTGTLRALDEGGAPLPFAAGGSAAATYTVAPGGFTPFRFALGPAPAGASRLRSARLEIVPDAGQAVPQVQVVEERTWPIGPAGSAVLPRAVPPSRSGTDFAVPLDGSRRDAGLVLTSAGSAPAEVVLSLVGLDGVVRETQRRTVAPGGQGTFLSSEVFAAAGAAVGTFRAETATALWGVGVLRSVNSRDEEILVGFPAWGGAVSDAPGRLPYLVDGDSWSTHLWLLGGAQAVRAGIGTVDRNGAAWRLPVVWP